MAIALENVDERGSAPKARIKDHGAAYKVYTQIADASRVFIANQRVVDDEIKGAPPNDPDDMADAGLGQMSNVNFLEAAADDENARASYVGLNDATPHLAGFRTTYGDEADRAEYEENMAIAFDWLLKKRFAGFHKNEQLNATWYVRDGLGIPYWPHDVDWRWKVGRLGQFLFPIDAEIDESKLDVALFVEDKSPPELFQMLRRSKRVREKEEKSAVNEAVVIKAIQDCGGTYSNRAVTYEQLEKRFHGNDIGEAYGGTARMTIVHLYVREFPDRKGVAGRVSHYIIRADGKGEGFLYKKRNAFPSMQDFLTFYADGVGDGSIASLQGQIAKSFPIYIQKDLLRNKWIDHTTLNLNLYMQAKEGGAGGTELLAQQAFGSLSILSPGVSFVQIPGSPVTGQQCTPLLAELNRVGANNNGAYQQHAISPEGGSRTLGEVNLQAAQSASLQSAKVTNYYLARANHYWNVVKRLQNKAYTSADPGWEERQEFFQMMHQTGGNDLVEAFYHVVEVTPMRAVGYGSYQSRQAAFANLNTLRGFMDPTGQMNLNRDIAAASASSYDNAARYFGSPAQPRVAWEQKFADLQNVGFASGVPSPVYPDDNHQVHAIEHDKFINGLIQQATQGGVELPQAVKALGAALDHQTQTLEALAASGNLTAKPLIKPLQKSLGNAVKQFRAMQAQVEQVQQQAAPAEADPNQSAAMPAPSVGDQTTVAKTQAQIAEINARIAREDAKAQANVQLKALEAGARSHPGFAVPEVPPTFMQAEEVLPV